MVLPPPWLTGQMEAPAGTKNMGTWTAKVFTPEQQARLGVDEQGVKVGAASSTAPARPAPAPAPAPAGRIGMVGPAWTRGEMERPAGTKDMGTYKTLVYTPEQQGRLGVDESGDKVAKEVPLAKASSPAPLPVPAGKPATPVGLIGPAWTRGEIEKPTGTKDMGTWKKMVYTSEQQERLGVDEDGNKLTKEQLTSTKAGTGPQAITAEYAAALLNSEKLLSDMCKKYFRKYDKNKDSFLESEEIGVLCQDLHSGLGINLTEKEVEESMKTFSSGMEAGLKEEEFASWFSKILQDTVKSQVSEAEQPKLTELKVRALKGDETTISIEGSCSVADLAKRAAAMLDLPVAKTKIACGGEVLEDGASIESAKLDANSDLTAVVMNSIKVRRHVYQARGVAALDLDPIGLRRRGGAPPYRGYHLVATDEVELEPGKKLGEQWAKMVPQDGYPGGKTCARPFAFQSTPSFQVPKMWEGGMNEVAVEEESAPEDVFGVDGEESDHDPDAYDESESSGDDGNGEESDSDVEVWGMDIGPHASSQEKKEPAVVAPAASPSPGSQPILKDDSQPVCPPAASAAIETASALGLGLRDGLKEQKLKVNEQLRQMKSESLQSSTPADKDDKGLGQTYAGDNAETLPMNIMNQDVPDSLPQSTSPDLSTERRREQYQQSKGPYEGRGQDPGPSKVEAVESAKDAPSLDEDAFAALDKGRARQVTILENKLTDLDAEYDKCNNAMAKGEVSGFKDDSAIRAARSVVEDVGESGLAKSKGLVELSKASGERGVHRVVKKFQVTLPVEISDLPKRRGIRFTGDFKAITLRAWCKFILEHNLWHALVGLHKPDDARERAILLEFWKRFEVMKPHHQLWQEFSQYNIDRSRCCPVLLHGDEGRGKKRSGFLVVAYHSYIGFGTAASKERKKHRPYARMGLNYTESTYMTRMLTAVLPKMYKDEVAFETIMEFVKDCALDVLRNGVLSPHGPTHHMAVLHCSGDWAFLVKAGKLTRSFSCVEKRPRGINSIPRGICHMCKAGQLNLPFEDFGRNPIWEPTMFEAGDSPFTARPVLLGIPHEPSAEPGFFAYDLWHAFHLGLGKTFTASALALISDRMHSSNVDGRFAELTLVFLQWCDETRTTPFLTTVTKDSIGWQDRNQYPNGMWSKGHVTTCFMRFLAHWLNTHDVSDCVMLTMCREATDAINRCFALLYSEDLWLRRDVAQQVGQDGLKFMGLYQRLARYAFDNGRALWVFMPKGHVCHHIFLDCANARAGWHMSPLAHAVQLSEDFVGKTSRLARRVHPSQAIVRVLQRSLQSSFRAWKDAGFLKA
eukprot:Skav200325  [mRNA]  locus=scaffold1760:150800:168374:- [translate_table: standard]